MSYPTSLSFTWQSTLTSHKNTLINPLFFIILGTLILSLAAQLSVPFKPVPLTLQSTTAILIGMVYGSRKGSGVILSYLIAGILGFPVFAELSSGLPVLLGPTGGYLIGFLPAAWIGGFLAEKGFAENKMKSFLACCVAAIILFSCGVLQLSQFIGLKEAFALGVTPFIFSESVKLLLIACLIPKCWKKIPG